MSATNGLDSLTSHIIVLIRSGEAREYGEYDTIGAACDAMLQVFEKELKARHPGERNISYSVDDFFDYIDKLDDVGVLTAVTGANTYAPHGKDWLKRTIFQHLQAQSRK